MKKFAKILIFIFLLVLIAMPILSFAAEPLVKCGTEVYPPGTPPSPEGKILEGTIKNPCGFTDFLSLVNRVIKFVLFDLALPVAAIMFAWAGFLMVTAGGSTERVTKAKRIFTNVAIGFIIAVIAFLIVRTILAILGFKGDWIGF